MTLVAKWHDQYYLTVISKRGVASGAGWYDSGQAANIQAAAPSSPPGNWMRYVFDGWGGDFKGNSMNTYVAMTGPKTVTAQWREDYTPGVINGMIISSVGAAGVYIYRKTKKRETAAAIANEIVPTSAIGRDEMVLANEIYQG